MEKMNLEIDHKVINKTTKCNKEFSCLGKQGEVRCQVETCLNDEVYFVDCQVAESCLYKMSFGFSMICNCPTRQEIYKRYKK